MKYHMSIVAWINATVIKPTHSNDVIDKLYVKIINVIYDKYTVVFCLKNVSAKDFHIFPTKNHIVFAYIVGIYLTI